MVCSKDEPLSATGDKAEHICAFSRNWDGDALMVAAARFPLRLEADPDWNGPEIPIPALGSQTLWRDLLSGHLVEFDGDTVDATAVLKYLPIAVLIPAEK
jgi:(1->4)-alpha-D-glucan 1-alpha-D-glucosylmutase